MIDTDDGNPDIDSLRSEPRVLWHQAECTDLASVARLDVDAYDAAEADRHAASQPYAAGSDDASFDRVAREVHLGTDDHVVSQIEQIVIADRQRVHVDAAANPRAVQAEIGRQMGEPLKMVPAATRTRCEATR